MYIYVIYENIYEIKNEYKEGAALTYFYTSKNISVLKRKVYSLEIFIRREEGRGARICDISPG